jgi:hypothetical protein
LAIYAAHDFRNLHSDFPENEKKMQQFDDGGIEINFNNGKNEKSPTKPLNEFPTQADDEPHLIFECSLCGVSAPADYFGPSPHFTKPIR